MVRASIEVNAIAYLLVGGLTLERKCINIHNLVNREKERRQRAILGLIEKESISSQENLRKGLKQRGYSVTQATLSRDLKELNVVKISSSQGEYKYAVLDDWSGQQILSCEVSGNLLVVRTEAGAAPAVAYKIDFLGLRGVLGTVAGEDTLLVVVAEGQDAYRVRKKLWKGVRTA